jgi:hypothetical protein
MSTVSYEEALGSLSAMFPDFDVVVLEALLESNRASGSIFRAALRDVSPRARSNVPLTNRRRNGGND